MEIEKGYTLSQFVDKLDNLTNEEAKILETKSQDDLFDIVGTYNDFLKQLLKKEMFVNEIEKPNLPKAESIYKNGFNGDVLDCKPVDVVVYENAVKVWQESEKKVIFKGWTHDGDGYYINGKYSLTWFDDTEIELMIMDEWGTCKVFEVETMGDLFLETNGELETKNLEI